MKPHPRGFIAAILVVAITVVPLWYAKSAPANQDSEHFRRISSTQTTSRTTFSRDIAPIIFANCATCHRPGEAGPFSLLNYEEVKKHARQIARVTESRFIPPWLPEPQEFKFADERRLTSAQISAIKKWIDDGEIEGNPADLPHLWLQVLPRKKASDGDQDLRRPLQEAIARHNLEKNPRDFEAHYNLASMLQMRGKVEEAVVQYAEALKIRPQDAVANNALGGAYLASGHVDDAIPPLIQALKTRPDYFDAHYNLGNALAMRGDFQNAVAQFRAAVQIGPEDANAQANSGSALAQIGELAEAKTHFERALPIDPNHQLARENLQQLLQETAPH